MDANACASALLSPPLQGMPTVSICDRAGYTAHGPSTLHSTPTATTVTTNTRYDGFRVGAGGGAHATAIGVGVGLPVGSTRTHSQHSTASSFGGHPMAPPPPLAYFAYSAYPAPAGYVGYDSGLEWGQRCDGGDDGSHQVVSHAGIQSHQHDVMSRVSAATTESIHHLGTYTHMPVAMPLPLPDLTQPEGPQLLAHTTSSSSTSRLSPPPPPAPVASGEKTVSGKKRSRKPKALDEDATTTATTTTSNATSTATAPSKSKRSKSHLKSGEAAPHTTATSTATATTPMQLSNVFLRGPGGALLSIPMLYPLDVDISVYCNKDGVFDEALLHSRGRGESLPAHAPSASHTHTRVAQLTTASGGSGEEVGQAKPKRARTKSSRVSKGTKSVRAGVRAPRGQVPVEETGGSDHMGADFTATSVPVGPTGAGSGVSYGYGNSGAAFCEDGTGTTNTATNINTHSHVGSHMMQHYGGSNGKYGDVYSGGSGSGDVSGGGSGGATLSLMERVALNITASGIIHAKFAQGGRRSKKIRAAVAIGWQGFEGGDEGVEVDTGMDTGRDADSGAGAGVESAVGVSGEGESLSPLHSVSPPHSADRAALASGGSSGQAGKRQASSGGSGSSGGEMSATRRVNGHEVSATAARPKGSSSGSGSDRRTATGTLGAPLPTRAIAADMYDAAAVWDNT